MHLVICTGTGLVVVAIGLTALFFLMLGLIKFVQWCERHIDCPDWLGNILVGVSVIMLIVAIIALSHIVGCKVIHLIH